MGKRNDLQLIILPNMMFYTERKHLRKLLPLIQCNRLEIRGVRKHQKALPRV